MNRVGKISLVLFVVISAFFIWQYVHLSNQVNKEDVYKYQFWRNSIEMTHYFLTKDIEEENDLITAVQMYYRGFGYGSGKTSLCS